MGGGGGGGVWADTAPGTATPSDATSAAWRAAFCIGFIKHSPVRRILLFIRRLNFFRRRSAIASEFPFKNPCDKKSGNSADSPHTHALH
jgi:hypothetical protein